MKHGVGILGAAVTALVVSVLVVRFANTATPGGTFSRLVGRG